MMKALTFVLILGCLAGIALGDVVELTENSFDEIVPAADLALVKFFAPWCGHCKALAPEYIKAAEQLGDKVLLAEVDCTQHKLPCSKFGVRGYPTLKVFRKGQDQPTDYAAGRTADAIVSFMSKQLLPAVSELQTAEEALEFAKSDRVVAIGVFESVTDTEAVAFRAVAESQRDNYMFGMVTDPAVAQALEGATMPSVVVYKSFGEKAVLAEFGDDAGDKILTFVKAEAFKLVDEISGENYQMYVDRGLPFAYLFVSETHDDEVKVLEEAAEGFKGKYSFVYLDGKRYGKMAERLGAEEDAPLPLFILDVVDEHYVMPSEGYSAEALKAFLAGVEDGSVRPTIKSAPIPESNEGPNYVVVGDTYTDIVLDSQKHVFVKFFAPWCGHCKSLAPVWEELAQKIKDDPELSHVVIAEIDATENDHPGVQIQGFPTLKFFAADAKDTPLEYSGARELDALYAYVKEKAVPIAAAEPAATETKDEL